MPTFADDLIPSRVFLPELSPAQEGRGGFGEPGRFTGPGGSPGQGAGLPAVVLPFPTPPPPAPTPTQPVRFPVGVPAANDPIFSRALPFLKIGSVIVGVAAFFDFLVREAQEERINIEQAERDAVDELLARRLGSDNPLAVVTISSPLDRPTPPVAEIIAPPRPGDFQLPTSPAPTPIEISPPELTPLEIGAPELTPAPVEIPAPVVTPAPRAKPSSAPLPIGTPGIGTPSPVFVPTSPGFFGAPRSPVAFPTFPPLASPRLQPVGDPLTPFSAPGVPSTRTTFQPGDVRLPQQQPQPQTQQRRRCKPCPKKKRRRRNKCFKGLFREGPFSDQVTFKKWVEIDCSSGRELGKRKRPTGPPELKIVRRIKKAAKEIIGG